jgi:membrane-associated protein
LIQFILHFDAHLAALLAQYGVWVYAMLFGIVFAETGFVVTPFLPGDSLLFATGAMAALEGGGTLSAPAASVLLAAAAILGNTLNYAVGRRIGPPAFSGRVRWLKVEYLRRTEAYFERYGAATVLIARFVPIVRTVAPFVAGIGRMPIARFQLFNIVGGVSWAFLFVWGGYFFGNIPWIRRNFGLFTIAIILLSLLPLLGLVARQRRSA